MTMTTRMRHVLVAMFGGATVVSMLPVTNAFGSLFKMRSPVIAMNPNNNVNVNVRGHPRINDGRLIVQLRSIATKDERETSESSKTSKTSSPVKRPILTEDEEEEEEKVNGVVCARGVCVIAEEEAPEECYLDESTSELKCTPKADTETNNTEAGPALTVTYLWPRALLLACSVLYGTNFPLGRLMNEALPASAATSSRMLLASVALSPFLLQLKPQLRGPALLCGSFTALGYVSQSLALVDTPAATVSFLGALVVIVCPALAVIVDKRKMAFRDAPQTWISAALCLVGVALLELGGQSLAQSSSTSLIGWGDVWSVLQAVGFGTSFFLTERMMAKEPKQALPITAVQCATSAAISALWAILDGTGVLATFTGAESSSSSSAWLLQSQSDSFVLPGLFFDPSLRTVAIAAAFTGLITTAGNRVGETVALGKLSSSEASVLLATEPLWAALFANYLIGETLGLWDAVGGALIVIACLTTAIDPSWLRNKLGIDYDDVIDNQE